MIKKTSKYHIFSGALLVLTLLLVAYQPMIAFAQEKDGKQAKNPGDENINVPGQKYFEEYLQASQSLGELREDVPTETEVIVDAYSPGIEPGIEMRRTWLESRSFLTVYTVRSDRPAWVVFHADEDGLPGAILHNIFVGSGMNRIASVDYVGEINSQQIHVMLHYDFGRSSLFEFPGPDRPVFLDNEIVNELCFCPF